MGILLFGGAGCIHDGGARALHHTPETWVSSFQPLRIDPALGGQQLGSLSHSLFRLSLCLFPLSLYPLKKKKKKFLPALPHSPVSLSPVTQLFT